MKLYLVAPLIAFVVAGWHFIALRHPPNTPWKRGGFGMYTEPSIRCRNLWIGKYKDNEFSYSPYPKAVASKSSLRYVLFDFKCFPNAENEANLLDKMVKIGALSLDERPLTILSITESRLDQHKAKLDQNILYHGEVQ